jgi:hypothetical protein
MNLELGLPLQWSNFTDCAVSANWVARRVFEAKVGLLYGLNKRKISIFSFNMRFVSL